MHGVVLLAVVCLGCRGPSRAQRLVALAVSQTVPESLNYYHGRPRPTIVDVSPTSVVVAGGMIQPFSIHVKYRIQKSSAVRSAVLRLWNDASGVLDTMPVPVQDDGEADWTTTTPIEAGPRVRFQVTCSNGESNAFIWGAWRMEGPERQGPAIVNVTPNHVAEAVSGFVDPEHPTIPITVWGKGFDTGCALHATINDRDAPLLGTMYGGNRITTFIKREDLGPGPIFARWFLVQLIIRGPDGGMEFNQRVMIVDQ